MTVIYKLTSESSAFFFFYLIKANKVAIDLFTHITLHATIKLKHGLGPLNEKAEPWKKFTDTEWGLISSFSPVCRRECNTQMQNVHKKADLNWQSSTMQPNKKSHHYYNVRL